MISDGQDVAPQEVLPAGSLWLPVQGQEVGELVQHLRLDPVSSARIVSEASTILSKCIPPQSDPDRTTGLVLGYVQSGKTLAFTTVAALARDNGFPIIIIITGISNPLLNQSIGRLDDDLRLQINRKWRLFRNPTPANRQSIADVLADWRDDRLPNIRRKTILITVLKNSTHLRNLNSVLGQLELNGIPALVVDDEADQAGLNTAVARGSQSTTYQRLVTLRQHLPHHTYIQVTATPQAPLLVNIIDVLSPRFVQLLTPGDNYVGGDVFFNQRPELVKIIPSNEIPNRNNPLVQVPPSLLASLRIFFLGVAAGFLEGDDQREGHNRSMLVHPSRETTGHGQFFHWITQIRQQWLVLLTLGVDEPERISFIDSFREAFVDLAATAPGLPDFDALVSELEYSIRHTMVLEMNARPRTPEPTWRDAYPWILVGGQAMDRGFTVEGLTVTYMPRDMGVGNADTVQQRARFFGYKRSYLGYCRVYLETGLRDAFQSYVRHERDLRDRLQRHQDSGKALTEWRRAFFLDSSLRPTRRTVLDLDYRQEVYSDDWFWPKVPHGSPELLSANRAVVDKFIKELTWHDAPGDSRRTADQVHLVCDAISLRHAYEELLMPLKHTEERDSQLFTGLLLQVEAYLETHSDALCSFYLMRSGATRMRSVNDDDEIPTLFQGANYADHAKQDMIYPGDDRERAQDGVTIQLHNLEIRERNQGAIIAPNVPTVAVWIPRDLAQEWLVQRQ